MTNTSVRMKTKCSIQAKFDALSDILDTERKVLD